MTAPLSCRLALKVIPNAPRNEIAGWLEGALKVKIHAPALEGRANDELCAFLAETLGLPRRGVTLVQGAKARHKIVQLEGIALSDVHARLNPNDSPEPGTDRS